MPSTLDLEEALWTLEETTLIYPERVLPQAEYSFKHVLTQEDIYHTLSPRRRLALHRQIAEAIETLYADNLREYYEQLAHHFYHSPVHHKAVEYLIKAGQKSYQAYYNEEARHYLNKALRRLDDLPAESVPAATVSAWRLTALTLLGEIHYGIGQHNQAETYFRQAIAVGENRGEAIGVLIRLYYWLGEVLHWLGRHEEAVRLGQAGLGLLAAAEARSFEAVLMNQMIAIAYANLNNQAEFRQLTRQTADFIQELPYSEELRPTYIHIVTGLCNRQPEQALRWIERLEQLAGEHYDLRAMAEAYEHRWGVHFDRGDFSKTLLNFSHVLTRIKS
jgi:predicted ATPase